MVLNVERSNMQQQADIINAKCSATVNDPQLEQGSKWNLARKSHGQ